MADRLGDDDERRRDQRRRPPYAGPDPRLVRAGPAVPPPVRADRRRGAARPGRHRPAPGPAPLRPRATTARCRSNEGWRTMPYLADGSAGIGMVLDRLPGAPPRRALRRRPRPAIRIAATVAFYVESGLFTGRAGMILHLARSAPPGRRPVRRRTSRRLAWHAIAYGGDLAFPGEQLHAPVDGPRHRHRRRAARRWAPRCTTDPCTCRSSRRASGGAAGDGTEVLHRAQQEENAVTCTTCKEWKWSSARARRPSRAPVQQGVRHRSPASGLSLLLCGDSWRAGV